jgi:sugar-specific transcriptional regulator TrmB
METIGLNKNEIKIYLDLVRHQNSTALEISKRAMIHRSNTYDALRKLIEKGFISEVMEEGKRFFRAMDPEKIKDYIHQQEQEVSAIIPYLKQFSSNSNNSEGVSIAKGVFAVRESLKDLIEAGKELKVFGAPKEAVDILGLGFLKEFHSERIKKKVLQRHIYNSDAIERVRQVNKMKLTEARCFPSDIFSFASTNICGDKILFLIFSNPVSAILIKNKDISDCYHNYFDLMWKKSKIVS